MGRTPSEKRQVKQAKRMDGHRVRSAERARDQYDRTIESRGGVATNYLRVAGNLALDLVTGQVEGSERLGESLGDLTATRKAKRRYHRRVEYAKDRLPVTRRVALSAKLAGRVIASSVR